MTKLGRWVLLGGMVFVLATMMVLGVGFLLLFGDSSARAVVCVPSGDSGTSSTLSVPANATLFQAIKAEANGDNRLAYSLLVGSYLESGWDNHAIGIGSYGPWQIQGPGSSLHPNITVEQAFDPVYSTHYMAPEYRKALRVVNPGYWISPGDAAERVAYAAERPLVDYYHGQGTAKVSQAAAASLRILEQLGMSTDFSSAPISGGSVPGAQAVTNCGVYANIGTGKAADVINAAESMKGLPYVYGGGNANGPTSSPLAHGNFGDVGFDCSGLVEYAFARAGMRWINGTAANEWAQTRQYQVDAAHVQPGDLVFFSGADGSSNAPGHVGIVVDPQKGIMINAPQTGDNVKESNYLSWGGLIGFTHPYQPVA